MAKTISQGDLENCIVPQDEIDGHMQFPGHSYDGDVMCRPCINGHATTTP